MYIIHYTCTLKSYIFSIFQNIIPIIFHNKIESRKIEKIKVVHSIEHAFLNS